MILKEVIHQQVEQIVHKATWSFFVTLVEIRDYFLRMLKSLMKTLSRCAKYLGRYEIIAFFSNIFL